MGYNDQNEVNQTFEYKKRSMLTDPNYTPENEVNKMLYKAGIRKSKDSAVSLIY